ncbi:hypothetical protein F5I97DRAFT_1929627 [Phlebopus sp. FC_14]|nr:hypothetical protein F5I97DRAFT_1929627 [Phlebopus sp. FC_14]
MSRQLASTNLRPERSVEYVCPVTGPDGSVGYDRPLENYFDTSFADQLLPSRRPGNLYDAIARAHDDRFELECDTSNNEEPDGCDTHPFNIRCRKRRRQVAKVSGNSPDYMGINPDLPGWYPRRSSYEDRRGRVPVQPGEVNTLVPYIPPIDTSMPPPSREWLDAKAKQILAPEELKEGDRDDEDTSVNDDDDDAMDWGYASDSTVHHMQADTSLSRPSTPPPPHVPESGSDSDEHLDSDLESDSDNDDQYDWRNVQDPQFSPRELADPPTFLIPRRKPSVVVADDGEMFMGGQESPVSLSHEENTSTSGPTPQQTRTKRKGRTSAPAGRSAKKQKQAKDTVTQTRRSLGAHDDEANEGSATGRSVSVPPITSIPDTFHGQEPATRSCTADPYIPKRQQNVTVNTKQISYPCLLDGCTHVCTSAGDLMRHQQSLRHRAPEYLCSGCGHAFTRPDALKRHLNNKPVCKKTHHAALSQATEMEGQ